MSIRFSIFSLLFFIVTVAFAEIKLPVIFNDGIVLQRDTKLDISGWASFNENVSLTFNGKTYKTKANKTGNWTIELPPQKAGGPFEMLLKGQNEIKVSNILFGDVWLCSGQSNMVLPMERVKEKYPDEIATADYPEIRNFFIPTSTNLNGAQADLPPGAWKEANPTDVLTFGAVAYFFARKIYSKYKIPIGIINASVGGTPIEAWISEEGFYEFPEILKTIEQNKDADYIESLKSSGKPWEKPELKDKGLLENPKWMEDSYLPKGWNNINIPGYWEDQGVKNLDGVVWYRKEIEVPASMTDVAAKLYY